jgi:hypothetical protein
MTMLFFHGCGKSKYAVLLLERIFDQLYVLPDTRTSDLHNNAINENGRDAGGESVDEALEHVNNEINVTHNPRSSWQNNECVLLDNRAEKPPEFPIIPNVNTLGIL